MIIVKKTILYSFLIVTIATVVLGGEQTNQSGWRSWLQKGKNYFMGQKKIMSQSVKAALRKPSLVTGVAGILGGAYLNSARAKAETIFIAYDEQGNIRDLTPEEHEKAYQAKLQAQFTTGPCYDKNYNPNADETKVIQEKLNKSLPDNKITAFEVPNTLYELSALDLMASGKIALNSVKNVQEPADFCLLNKDKNIQKADLEVNNDIVNRIKKLKTSVWEKTKSWFYRSNVAIKRENALPTRKDFHTLADTILPDLARKMPEPEFQKNVPLIHKVIDVEFETPKEYFLLWRGESNAREFSLKGKSITEQYKKASGMPISYGGSFLAGCRHDPTACAYNYITGKMGGPGGYTSNPSPVGYALPLLKEDYLKGNTGKMWYIPQLNIMAASTQLGRWWHPRTKVPETWRKFDTPAEFLMPGWWKYQKKEIVRQMFENIHNKFIPLTPAAQELKRTFDEKAKSDK